MWNHNYIYIYIYKQKKILYELSLFLSVQSTWILRFWNQLTNTHHSHTDKEGQNIPPSWFIAFTISLGEEFQKREELVFTESLNLKTQTFGGNCCIFMQYIFQQQKKKTMKIPGKLLEPRPCWQELRTALPRKYPPK